MSASFSFSAIGTKWQIDIYTDTSLLREREIEKKVKERIADFDHTYSRFREDSWVATLSQKAGKYVLPEDAEPLLSMYRDVYTITGGLVTPLIGQVLVDAGYDKDYSFVQKKELVKPPSWDEAIRYAPEERPGLITLNIPALLDVGAIGKGYLIDIVGSLLEREGIDAYSINAGGDILHANRGHGTKGGSLRVGLEHPEDFSKVIGVVTLQNKSIAGSSGNRRKWGNFHHIINPETLSSPKDIAAVWVLADTTTLADAMTTALYFTSAEVLKMQYAFEYLILYRDMSVEGSLIGSPVLELF